MGSSTSKSGTKNTGTEEFGAGNIQQAFLREYRKTTALRDVYEVHNEIGQSPLCKVYRIRKRLSRIGGTSRSENVAKKPFGFGSPSRSRTTSETGRSRFMSTPNLTTTDFLGTTPDPPIPPPGEFGVRAVSSGGSAEMYFALKEINLALIAPDKVEQLKQEVSFLKALDHKNILKAYETFHENKKLLIVMELLTGGDLYSRFPYTEQQAANITRQILSAVSYMHDNSVIHRDLKLENILFESEHPQSLVKVIDFGLSVKYSQTDILKERVGTLYSMSPETMRGDYASQADLWSIGVISFMLLSGGKQPFEAKSPKQLVAKVLLAEYSFDDTIWETISESAKEFIRSLLVCKPEHRLTAAQAQQHPWIIENTTNKVDESLKLRVGESMVRYASTTDFLKLALNVIAKKSTSSEIFELRAVFDSFDTRNTGTLDLSEFKAALAHFKYPEKDIEAIFRKIDVNKNNEINYTEFLAAALETQGAIEEYRLAEAFDLLDTDDSGYISKKNLREILGDRADERYLDHLIAEADFYKDGRISYAEFLQAFSRQRNELMLSIYGDSPDTSAREEEALRSSGLLSGLRKAFNSNNNLLNGHHRRKTSSSTAS